jgi:CubicO group peptidase (beta-lactamase class C family)
MRERLAAPDPEAWLGSLLADLEGTGQVSAAVALVGTADDVLAVAARGATPGTRFDLASLTKPVVGTLAVVLDQKGLLPLRLAVGDVYGKADLRLRRRQLGQLLRHRSGLAPWTPLYARCQSRAAALELLLSGELASGKGESYSDLGFLLWAFAAEDSLGTPLAGLLAEHVVGPLGNPEVGPPPGPRSDVAPCLLGNDREVALAREQGWAVEPRASELHGVAHDGNARFLGGLAGHAGLFGTARALWTVGREWLAPGNLLRADAVAAALAGGDRYTLGWWRRRVRGSAGPALSPRAFGMVGFTGGSCWMDPGPGLVAVLLAHRRSTSFDMLPWRRRFHRLAGELVRAAQPALAH